jgi:hypothetical protein
VDPQQVYETYETIISQQNELFYISPEYQTELVNWQPEPQLTDIQGTHVLFLLTARPQNHSQFPNEL